MATTLRRTEAKAFFANERTFLHWMNMSVTLGSISAALLGERRQWKEEGGAGHAALPTHHTTRLHLARASPPTPTAHPPPPPPLSFCSPLLSFPGVSGVAHKSWGRAYEGHALFARALATGMMVLSIFMAVYAARNFKVRGDMLQLKADGPYDSRLLPILLASVLIVALLVVFGGAVAELAGWG